MGTDSRIQGKETEEDTFSSLATDDRASALSGLESREAELFVL